MTDSSDLERSEFIEVLEAERAKFELITPQFTGERVIHIEPNDELLKLQYAHFLGELATRVDNGREKVLPKGIVNAAALLIYDLSLGKNGYTDKPIEGPSVGIDPQFYTDFMHKLPNTYRDAGRDDIAEAIEPLIHEIWGRPLPEWCKNISSPIDNIDDAKGRIIDSAVSTVVDLMSGSYEINGDETRELLEASSAITLTNAPVRMPMGLVNEFNSSSAVLLRDTPDHMKTQVTEGFWLLMTMEQIPPDYATFARDHIILKGLEVAAISNELDATEVTMQLYESEPALQTLLQRYTGMLLDFNQTHAHNPGSDINFE